MKNFTKSEGDTVTAGEVLGIPGTWDDTLGRVEIDVWSGVHHCPFTYFDEDLKTQYENKIWKLMEDWETYRYIDTEYDEASMTYAAGCLSATMEE